MDKDNLYYLISQNIKKQRKIKGRTQVKLAMKSNISVDYLKKLKQKVVAIKNSFRYSSKNAKALEIDVKDLFNKLD